jgi:DNA-binding NarL/FixJ family response regulator
MQRDAHEFEGAILVADDHEVFRFGLAQLLKRRLKTDAIIEAGRFEQVIDSLDRDDLKLALIDLDMPGLSSISQLELIARRRPDVRVVVISGSCSRQDILGSLAAGAHGYILKQQGSEVLIEKLRYILGGEIYVPPRLAERESLAHPAANAVVLAQPIAAPSATASPSLDGLGLSGRQMDVLTGLLDGLSNKMIARRLGVSEGTVKMHMASLFRALGAANRTHAVSLARQLYEIS